MSRDCLGSWRCWRRLVTVVLMGMVVLVCVPSAEATSAVRVYDFDETDGGFERVEDPLAVWQWGAPVGDSVVESRGNVWATELDQHYLPNALAIIRSPTFSLSSYPGATMLMVHYYDIDPNGTCTLSDGTQLGGVCGDGGFVRLVEADGETHMLAPSEGYNAQVVYEDRVTAAFSGTSEGWVTSYFDLEGMTGDDQSLELVFVSNETRWSDGWFISSLILFEEDIIPPQVSVVVRPTDTSNVSGPYPVVAVATDNRAIAGVTLHYQAGEEDVRAVDMVANDNGRWEADIPGQPTGTEVRYYVEAVDINGNTTTDPPGAPGDTWLSFRVRLPPPRSLDFVPSPPPSLALTLTLQWLPPQELGDEGFAQDGQYLIDYQVIHTVLDSEGQVVKVEVAEDQNENDRDLVAVVEPAGKPYTDQYQVRARYQVEDETGQPILVPGDLSDPVSTTLYVPHIQEIIPPSEYRGESTTVTIVGAYTTFVDGDVTVGFGRGIQVSDVVVESVTRCKANITVAPDAPLGPHPLTVQTGDYTLTYEPGLEVVDQALKPRIVDVEPDYIRVREKKQIKFTGANTDFIDESPSVDFWRDIQVLSLDVRSATEFVVEIEVSADAAVGSRTVRVISGGETFEVKFWVESEEVVTTSPCTSSGLDGSVFGDFSLIVATFGGLLLYRGRWRTPGQRLRGEYAVRRCASDHPGSGSLGPSRGGDEPGRGTCAPGPGSRY